MPYCSQCGVEVDDNVEKCPLCQTPIQKILPEGGPVGPYPEKPAGSPPVPPLTIKEKMAIARTITTMGILIPLLFVTAVDYFINRRVTWSLYVTASLTAAWFAALVSLFSWKRPYSLNGLLHLDVLVFLYALGHLAGEGRWFFPVGLPIVAGSGAAHLAYDKHDWADEREGGQCGGGHSSSYCHALRCYRSGPGALPSG